MSSIDSTQMDDAAQVVTSSHPEEAAASEISLRPDGRWRWFWVGLLTAAAPLLVPYFLQLWGNPTYRYFPFVFAAVGWLAYTRTDGGFYPPRGGLGWTAIALGLLLILVGATLAFPWFAAVAFVMFGFAMLTAMRGDRDRSLIAVAVPLITLIQPVRFDTLLVQRLQDITTWMSSVLLDAMAVPHAIANNVIQLADRELFVAEACSGIQSVFTLAFLSTLLIAWKRRRVWMTPIYLLIACMLAVFANVIRVTVVAVAATNFGVDLAEGWPHELLGYIALAVAAGFLLSFDYLIITFLHQVAADSEFNPLVAAWNTLAVPADGEEGFTASWRDKAGLLQRDEKSRFHRWASSMVNHSIARIGFVVVAALVGLASVSQLAMSRKPINIVFGDSELVFDPPDALFNSSLVSMEVVDHISNRGYQEPRLGANSDIWECEWNNLKAQFVLSQPHRGWHELCNCYERLGWLLLDRDIRSIGEFETIEVEAIEYDALEPTYVLGRFKKGPSQHAYLFFAGIGSDGTLLEAPGSLMAFSHRIFTRIDQAGVWDHDEVIMLQMWITTPEKLKPKQLRELEQDFVAARGVVAKAIKENATEIISSRSASWEPRMESAGDHSGSTRIAMVNLNETSQIVSAGSSAQ